MNRLDEVLIRHTFGRRDPDIFYEWNSLWQMSDTEKADVALKKAQAFKIDVDCGLIPPEALAKGRESQLIEDGTYPGLEAAIEEFQELNDKDGENVPEDNEGSAGKAPKELPNAEFSDDLGGGAAGSIGRQSGLGFMGHHGAAVLS